MSWDGAIRISPIRTTDANNGRLDLTMPPSGTRILAYIGGEQIGAVPVNDDGIELIGNTALYCIYDGNTQSNPNNFRILSGFGSNHWDFNWNNWYLIYVVPIRTTESINRFVKWIPGQITIPFRNDARSPPVLYNTQTGGCSWLDNRLSLIHI